MNKEIIDIGRARTYKDIVSETAGWSEFAFDATVRGLIELMPALESSGRYSMPSVRSNLQMLAARRGEMFPPEKADEHF